MKKNETVRAKVPETVRYVSCVCDCDCDCDCADLYTLVVKSLHDCKITQKTLFSFEFMFICRNLWWLCNNFWN